MPLPDEQRYSNVIGALNEVMARQDRLEARLTKLERVKEGSEATAEPLAPAPPARQAPIPIQPSPVVEDVVLEPVPIPAQARESVPAQPELETKVGLTIVNRIGVVTLVLGVGFFFKWAVDNNWIGPSGRVILGLLAGFITLAAADLLWRRSQQLFAQGITGAGVAIIYLSFYAAFDFYHLIPQTLAFVLLLATTGMAATLALRYNAIAIAALGFFGAYLIPLLLSNGEDHPWFLITYLLVINVAQTELGKRRNWQSLEFLSFAATLFIFGAWLLNRGGPSGEPVAASVGLLALCAQRLRTAWPLLFVTSQFLAGIAGAYVWPHSENFFWLSLSIALLGLAFAHMKRNPPALTTCFLSFWLSVLAMSFGPLHVMPVATAGFLLFASWLWWRSALRDEPPTTSGFVVFALNGAIYFAIAYYDLRQNYHGWLGLLAVAVAASYLAFGMFIHRKAALRERNLPLVLLALGLSVAFLTLAIPIQLTGFSVTIAWSIQAAALTWIGLRFNSSRAVIFAFVVFALAFLRLALVDSEMYAGGNAYTLLVNSRFFTFAVLGIALLLAAYWSSKLNAEFALVHFVAGHIVLLGGLTLEVIGWAERSAQSQNLLSVETIGTTILFAFYAVILVSLGVATRSAVSRLAGLALTAIVIVKLYFFDVWQLGRVYQIIAFVILGVLLLSTSFLYSRFRNLVSEWRKD